MEPLLSGLRPSEGIGSGYLGSTCEGKMKKAGWHDQPRQSRLAAVMYPHLASEETRQQMESFSDREGRKSPQQAKIEADRPNPSPFERRK